MDVVICAVSSKQALDQKLLVRVIKNLGSVKVVSLFLLLCVCVCVFLLPLLFANILCNVHRKI